MLAKETPARQLKFWKTSRSDKKKLNDDSTAEILETTLDGKIVEPSV